MKKFNLYWVNLDPTVGAEIKKTRPCLVISPDEMNAYLSTIIVVPLTSTKRTLPTRVLIKSTTQSGLNNDSFAAIDQVKTIDKSRIVRPIGEISESEKQEVTRILLALFDY